MPINQLERLVFTITRLLTLVAVLSSWLGGALMFFLGVVHTYYGFAATAFQGGPSLGDLPAGDATVVHLIGALDRFLIAVVLLYFGYGVYGLFVRPDRSPQELGLPDWLHVERIGELKQTLAEVIIVILFVLFLRIALKTFHDGAAGLSFLSMAQFLVLPVSILLLSLALRLVELHPKSMGPERARAKNGALPQNGTGPNGA